MKQGAVWCIGVLAQGEVVDWELPWALRERDVCVEEDAEGKRDKARCDNSVPGANRQYASKGVDRRCFQPVCRRETFSFLYCAEGVLLPMSVNVYITYLLLHSSPMYAALCLSSTLDLIKSYLLIPSLHEKRG